MCLNQAVGIEKSEEIKTRTIEHFDSPKQRTDISQKSVECYNFSAAVPVPPVCGTLFHALTAQF